MGDALRPLVMLLQEAELCLGRHELDRAAWRLADAAGSLRDLIEQARAHNVRPLIGVDEPTGAGFRLPVREEVPA